MTLAPVGWPPGPADPTAFIENAVVAVLTKFGPLSFMHIIKFVRSTPAVVGAALGRLKASGLVALHDKRWATTENGSARVRVYCLIQPPGFIGDAGSGGPLCPACGQPRSGP